MMREYVGIDAGKCVDLMVGTCGISLFVCGKSISFLSFYFGISLLITSVLLVK